MGRRGRFLSHLSPSYDAVIQYLFTLQHRTAEKHPLPWELAAAMGHPEWSFPVVHVAGTNGKGSVSLKIARALQQSGCRVGLFTSPHLFSYRERIEVNGEPISEEEVVAGMQRLRACALPATFFMYTTLLALLYFKERAVDVAVMEAGIGGRLDATNIVRPLLSVITSIGWDHADLLGDSLEAIASEKAGIIKPNVPVVVGPYARCACIELRALQLQAPLHAVEGRWTLYEEENCAVARRAMELLPWRLADAAVEGGLRARLPCRLEEVEGVLYDVAHNTDGFRRLFEALAARGEPLRVLVGMSQDKAVDACLSIAARHAHHLHLAEAPHPRRARCAQMAEALQRVGCRHYSCHASPEEAAVQARTLARLHKERLVVCGSFYLMAPVRASLKRASISASEGATPPSATATRARAPSARSSRMDVPPRERKDASARLRIDSPRSE